jgi:hypothetical protein
MKGGRSTSEPQRSTSGRRQEGSRPDLCRLHIASVGGCASLTQSDAEDFGGFFHVPRLDP